MSVLILESIKDLIIKSLGNIKVYINYSLNNIGGGTRLDPRTIVCEIRCEDGKTYKVRSFVSNAFIIEMNQRIVENP